MDRNLTGKRPTFRRSRSSSNIYRILLWIILIAGGLWLVNQVDDGQGGLIKPLFLPTPTATRTANSYLNEAEAYFDAGKIDDPTGVDAIDAYRQALVLEPNNAQTRAKLARIMTYSSSLLSTYERRSARLANAREEIDFAAELAPDDTEVHAIRAFVYDWSASSAPDEDTRQEWLATAEGASSLALNLDPDNYLALAFFAEVLLDQQQWSQAMKYSQQAVEFAPDVMDTHRVYATVLETFGQYRVAIEEYDKAASLAPNLTFLYIRIGVTYRELLVFERALEYFEKAVTINNSNGVADPLPYIGIAKTYSQMGEFFAAALNAQKALRLDPNNANTYGQLGIIYTKARNWESASLVLECAVLGCSVERTRQIMDDLELDIEVIIPVQGLAITNLEIAYYYVQYGSVLAALSPQNDPEQNNCPQVHEVLSYVRASYPGDPVLMGIIEENEAICQIIEGNPLP